MRCRLLPWLFVGFLFAISGSQIATAQTTEVTYKAAEAALDWLELASAGVDSGSLHDYYYRHIVPTVGCSIVVRHLGRFKAQDDESYFYYLMESIGRTSSDKSYRDSEGNLSTFGYRRQLWTDALRNPKRYRGFLRVLRERDVFSRAYELAKSYLPRGVNPYCRFHVVLLGSSPAFNLGIDNGLDLLQLPRTRENSLVIDEIVRMVAHEIHHSGFAIACRDSLWSVRDSMAIDFLQALAAEGMATAFINGMPDRLNDLQSWDSPMAQMVSKDWERLLPQLSDLYCIAEKDLRDMLDGTFSEQRVSGYWLKGAQGPLYVLGVDMIRTIQNQLGAGTAISIAEDVRRLLVLYNEAARKANLGGEAKYVFSDEIVRELMGQRRPR